MKKKVIKQHNKKETSEAQTGSEVLEFLPPEVIKVLEKSEYKFSQSEQILLTLLAQIIIEIAVTEEL